MTFHQILFLEWMRQGCIGKSYRQEPVSFISFYIYYKILQKKIKTVDVTFFPDVFQTTAWAFFSKIKSDLIDIFLKIVCVIFYILNSLN